LVKHDCDNNAELFRDGRCITFRVIKPIALGEEVTTHYGDGYCEFPHALALMSRAFLIWMTVGSKNKDCLCATCERRGVGGYAPVLFEGEDAADSMFARRANDSDSDSDDSSSLASVPEAREPVAPVNIDERSTRRGVYHVLPKQTEAESDPAEPSDEQALASDTIELDSSDGEVQEIGTRSPCRNVVVLLTLARTSSYSCAIQ
jgi:histone-lysine N-methyltransferase SUV420H